MRWNLDNLYKSFESPEFISDLNKLDDHISSIIEWSEKSLKDKENAQDKIIWWITRANDLGHLYSRLLSYSSLVFSVDANNHKAKKYEELLEVKMTGLTRSRSMFTKWLASLDNSDDLIEGHDLFKKHSFYLQDVIYKSRYMLDDHVEEAVARMKSTGSTAWTQLWNVLTSNHLVDFSYGGESKKLPLPVIRNMAYDKNSEIRKAAYVAELESYETLKDSVAGALNGIKGEVITVAQMRGYGSPLDMTLIDARMDRQTLDVMLSAIKESFPSFRKYFKKKGALLGHKNGLPFYDLFAPMGQFEMTCTFEEAREFIVKNFRNFSDELADFADMAFEENWIDGEPREGKRGGGFCENLHVIGESRIMTNFTGTFNDVNTLAHELGHAYHGDCLKNETYLNSDYPMPLAETASIFCETIILNAALKDANKEQAFTLLENSISDGAQIIVDIYSRYLFETELFEKRKNGSLSVEELNQAMINGQKGSYGDGLDPHWLHPYMWICKPHYYYSDFNFYNFPYAFGLLFAKGLYAEYLKRGDSFVEDYKNLLKATGSNNTFDVAQLMGIDVRSKKFWKSSLDIITQDIERFLELS